MKSYQSDTDTGVGNKNLRKLSIHPIPFLLTLTKIKLWKNYCLSLKLSSVT